MTEIYLIVFLCIIVALAVGFMAVTAYMVWFVIMHDLEEQRKENGDEFNQRKKQK